MWQIDSERKILGALLKEPESYIELSEGLTTLDFHGVYDPDLPNHRAIFEAIIGRYQQGQGVDPVLIASDTQLPKSEVSALWEVNSDNVAEHIKLVRKATKARDFEKIKNLSGSVEDRIRKARKVLDDLDVGEFNIEDHHISSIAKNVLARVEVERHIPLSDRVITTDLRDLNKAIGGLYKSQFSILGGRPGMGKTLFLSQLMLHMSNKGQKIAFFILETSTEQLFERMVTRLSGIPIEEILKLTFFDDPEKTKNYYRAVSTLSKGNIYLFGSEFSDFLKMSSVLRQLTNKVKLDCVIVDYIQLMTHSGQRWSTRALELGAIAKGLAQIATSEAFGNPHVTALAQLNRGVESRPDKRPNLQDLKESGSLEEAAHLVYFLYRDEYYYPETEQPGIIEFILGKNRNGKVQSQTVKCQFDGASLSIRDLARGYEQSLF